MALLNCTHQLNCSTALVHSQAHSNVQSCRTMGRALTYAHARSPQLHSNVEAHTKVCSCTLLGALWRHALIPLTPGLAWATVGNLPLCQSTHLSLSSPRVSSYSFVLFLLFFICRTRFHPFSHLPVILMDQVIRGRN